MNEIFTQTTNNLQETIADRALNKPKESYTVSLLESGNERVAQKVGEEGLEVAIAAVKKDREQIIYELSDLWYHILILLHCQNISLDEIGAELEKRHK